MKRNPAFFALIGFFYFLSIGILSSKIDCATLFSIERRTANPYLKLGGESALERAELICPSGILSERRPKYCWYEVTDGAGYKLLVRGSKGKIFSQYFRAERICSDGLCCVIPEKNLTNGKYRWKVRVFDQQRNKGPWSRVLSFVVDGEYSGPQPVSPHGSITDKAPKFTWTAGSEATRYKLEIKSRTSTIFTKWYRAAKVKNGENCSVKPDLELKDGEYVWRVRAWNGQKGRGPWSNTLAFKVTSAIHKMTLKEVKYWAYNIADCNTRRQRNELVGSHFDMYVLEPVVTEKGEENFDIAGLIRDIRESNIRIRDIDPLILAYVDIGQAEDWRWYFEKGWRIGNPEWILGEDPDDWEGCYPVAYWYPTWQNIVIYGYKGRSMVEETLKAGFDGIYMDWVDAFSDGSVVKKARKEGVNPAREMFLFIERIREYARSDSIYADSDYLVIAQNAPDLYEKDPQRYRSVIDAIACEAIWYDGDGGFEDWNDPSGYNVPTNQIYPGWTEELLEFLQPIKKHMPVFCAEYAQDLQGKNFATQVYQSLAPTQGFIPYCTRRSLARLSKTPYPWGYEPIDY
jgi:cysteinyl-tRNA synthetase